MNYREILAIDPGTHCGFARFINGIQSEVGTLHGEEEIWPWLIKQKPDLFVIEDYKIRDEQHGGFNHAFASVFPAQVIGAFKFYCAIRDIPYVLQQPSIKNAACPMLTGKPYRKQANKHYWDAFLHGGYYIKKAGLKYGS